MTIFTNIIYVLFFLCGVILLELRMPHKNSEKKTCADCINSNCLVKKNFTIDHLNNWESQKIVNQYKKGDSIFSKDDSIIGLNIVMTGAVELFLNGYDNKMEIVRFAGNGDIFGHISIENENYPSNSIAKVDTVVCFFRNSTLLEMHQSNPKFAFELISFFSRNHNKTVKRLIQNLRMNLREKVAEALITLYNQFGLDENKELIDCFNREDIASLANTNAEQVSRQLSEFEKEKIIEKRSRRIAILDIQKLKKITHYYYTEF